MAWNFSGGGCVEFLPVTSTALGFIGMTVDFKGEGRFWTLYESGDVTYVQPIYLDLSGGVLEIACEGAVRRRWDASAANDGEWHHLNVYTNSEMLDGVAILDGVTLTPTSVNNVSHIHAGPGLTWIIGGFRTVTSIFGAFSGRMAHLNIGITQSDLFWNGVDKWRDSVRVHRVSPMFYRNFASSGVEDPDGVVYLSMDKTPSLAWDDISGQPLTIVGSVTVEDTPTGWWVIPRMAPYIDAEFEGYNPPPEQPPTPIPVATKIVAEFIL